MADTIDSECEIQPLTCNMADAGRRVLMPHALVDNAGDTLGRVCEVSAPCGDTIGREGRRRDKHDQKGEKENSVRLPMYQSLEELIVAITSVGRN